MSQTAPALSTSTGMDEDARRRQMLADGVDQMGLSLEDSALEGLIDYWTLLRRWNQRFNLVARSDPERWLSRHILDCLSLLPKLPAPTDASWRALDAGSGAGLPGAVLAIARPDGRYMLVERMRRRCHFLQNMKMELQLDSVEVVNARLEECHPKPAPDLILARALKPLEQLLPLLAPLCAVGTELLLQRSEAAPSAAALGADYELLESEPILVPGLALRHVLHLRYRGHGNR